ncbi:cytochrome b5-like heme/steroid binding domain-containing protein [Talaromyces proteolyticus]|uniref:Cytochrome b5-like heme/steroid binding domain-containing protein n=1 Tax=Talaromyces proteolyticus TaxID=1131652 RepID=A0AAD4KWB0_9EURO|nr:cytochrome b5-like heme/steroid binding domain-containing protein [Talaromyces proteolyticus]KAH8701521.1 cytochrome b5-like heme/steroid binding domain-containing protein [Talaromyces proteolyticus]
MSRKLTHADVAEHTDRHNLWMIIHENVLDLCQFIKEHPGGEEVLMDQAGKDASAAFDNVGHSPEARDILKTLTIGVLEKQV